MGSFFCIPFSFIPLDVDSVEAQRSGIVALAI